MRSATIDLKTRRAARRARPLMSTSFAHSLALLLMRLMLAAVFFYHGTMKLFGWWGGGGMSGFTRFLQGLGVHYAFAAACLATAAELGGAVALLLGYRVRLAVLPMIFSMLVASFLAHRHAFDVSRNGMEYTLTLAVMLAAVGLLGPGRYAIRG